MLDVFQNLFVAVKSEGVNRVCFNALFITHLRNGKRDTDCMLSRFDSVVAWVYIEVDCEAGSSNLARDTSRPTKSFAFRGR